MVEIRIENGKYELEGEFDFEMSTEVFYDEKDDIPYRDVTFRWNVDCPQGYEVPYESVNVLLDKLAERLKEDFRRFLDEKWGV